MVRTRSILRETKENSLKNLKLRRRRQVSPVLLLLEERQLLSTVFDVTKTTDSPTPEQGEFRYAVNQVNALAPGIDAEIVFQTTAPIEVTQGQVVVSHDVTMQGGTGDTATTVTTNGPNGLLVVAGVGTQVTINDLTLSGTAGEGIDNEAGQLMLQGCTVTGFGIGLEDTGQAANLFNSKLTGNNGVGAGSGSAIDATLGTDAQGDPGVIYVIGCTISGNGGGSPVLNDEGGPAFDVQMTAVNDVFGVETSTVSGNLDGAFDVNSPTATARFFVDASSIVNNLSGAATVAINNGSNLLDGDEISGNSSKFGGTVQYFANLDANPAPGSELDVQYSSLVDNTVNTYSEFAGYMGADTTLSLRDDTIGRTIGGGGLDVTGYVPSGQGIEPVVTVISSTIADNYPGNFPGGGITVTNVPVLTLTNSIVAGNGPSENPDIYASQSAVKGDYDLIQNATGVTGLGPHSLLNVNAELAPLGNYGGPFQTDTIQTYALYSNSPAAGNAGDPSQQQTADATGNTRTAGAIYIGADNVTIPAPGGGTGSGGTGTGSTGTGGAGNGGTGTGGTGIGSTGTGSTGTGGTPAPAMITLRLHHERVVDIHKHDKVVDELVVNYNPHYASGFASVTFAPLAHAVTVRELRPHHKAVDEVLAAGTVLTLDFGENQLGVYEFIDDLARR